MAVKQHVPCILDLLHLLSPPHEVDGLKAMMPCKLDDLPGHMQSQNT